MTAANTTGTDATGTARKLAQPHADLDRRYGKIGISAVAAALRYYSQAARPAANSTEASDVRDRRAAGA